VGYEHHAVWWVCTSMYHPFLLYSVQEETASSIPLGAKDFLFSKTSTLTLFNLLNLFHRSRGSSVGKATRYRLDGPRIESWWGARFSAPVQTSSDAHPASYTVSTRSFLGVKWPGHGVVHPPPSSAEVKERVYTSTPPLCLCGLL
jgi:hypothetical protein